MPPILVQATELRLRTRDVLDHVQGGGDAVISRQGKPIGYLSPYIAGEHPEPAGTPEDLLSEPRYRQVVAARCEGEE